MKNTGVLRRDFIKGVATSALSLAISPSLMNMEKLNTTLPLSALKNQTKAVLPPFFDCSMYMGPGFPSRPDFPKASNLF